MAGERLVTDLWEDDEGPASRRRLRVLVSRLRHALGPAAAALVRSPGHFTLVSDVSDLAQARLAAQRGFVPWAAISHRHLATQLRRRAGTGDGDAAARHTTAAVQLAERSGTGWLVEHVRRSSDRR